MHCCQIVFRIVSSDDLSFGELLKVSIRAVLG